MAGESISQSDSIDHEPRSRLDRLKGKFRYKKDTATKKGTSPSTGPDKSFRNDIQSLQKSEPRTSARVSPQSQDFKSDTEQGPRPPHTEQIKNSDIITGKIEGHLESTTDQGLRPPQSSQSDKNDVVSAEDEARSKDLWLHAYEILKLRDPDLVTAYERHLASANISHTASASPSLSPELIESIIKPKLEDRDAKRLVLRLGREPIKLLLNSSTQSQAMIEGLGFISDLLRLYKYKESVYLHIVDKPAYLDFVKAVEELYADIFEYQVRLICFLSRSWIKRGLRGTMQLDDWIPMLEKIKSSNDRCNEYRAVSSEEKVLQFYDNESSYIKQSIGIQNRVVDMFESSRAQRQEERRDDKEAGLLEALASDYKSDKDSISVRVPGTCEWFLEDERFLNWRNNKSSGLLWVSAGPGCGKSVLSRALIDERRVCSNAMTSTVCYFFFKDGQEHRTRGANALSAILHQLFENSSNLIAYALPSYKNYGEKLQDAFSELWGVLIKCAKDPEAGEIICVLDALDECEEGARDQLIHTLVALFSRKESYEKPPSTLKFLVTSRPYDNIEEQFEALAGASTYLRFDGDDKSQKIGQEIDLVIDAKLPEIAGGFSNENRNRISARLKNMNNRTYLWLYLTIDIIKGSRSNYRKVSSIDMLLSNLPSTVSDAYERILAKSVNKVYARTLLQIIVAATRPLTLMEANFALTLATQQGCTSHKALDLWPLHNFKSTVQNICGFFVSVHDEKLSLIHQTAREFLTQTSEPCSAYAKEWQGCFDIATAHGTISKICLDYLNFDEFATTGNRDQDEKDREIHLLLNYTAANWPVHYTSQPCRLAKDSQKAAQSLCNNSLSQITHWFPKHYLSRHNPIHKLTSLGIASYLGLLDVAKAFLEEGADVNAIIGIKSALLLASERGHEKIVQMLLENGADVNAQSESYGNALHAASLRGHDKVVQMLLENGANVNGHERRYGSALRAASRKGHEEIVQILLKNKADANAQLEHSSSALQGASFRGYDKVVRMLLENEADVNAQGGYHGNALQAASSEGYDKVVQMLLENKADVNAQGGYYGNALQAASSEGHDKVVQMLLENGADINAQCEYSSNALCPASFNGYDKAVQMRLKIRASRKTQGRYYGNALQAASFKGYDKVVQMLLKNKASVNAQGGYYGNALQAASFSGSERVLQILLEHEADVNAQGGQYHSALQAASYRGNENMVEMLLQNGADLNRKDKQGRTALHMACAGGQKGCFEKLSSLVSDLTVVDKQGRSCLHHAASGGSVELVTWLLREGFDPNLSDRDGWTPLHWAAKSGSDETVQVLLGSGAKSTMEAINGWTPDLVAIFHNNFFPISDVPVTHGSTESGLSSGQDIDSPTAATNDACRVGPGFGWGDYLCDGCELEIFGTRYSCSICQEFDYCFKCKASSKDTHDDHKFIMRTRPKRH